MHTLVNRKQSKIQPNLGQNSAVTPQGRPSLPINLLLMLSFPMFAYKIHDSLNFLLRNIIDSHRDIQNLTDMFTEPSHKSPSLNHLRYDCSEMYLQHRVT